MNITSRQEGFGDCKFTMTDLEKDTLHKELRRETERYGESMLTEDVRILVSLLTNAKAFQEEKLTYCNKTLERIEFYLDRAV